MKRPVLLLLTNLGLIFGRPGSRQDGKYKAAPTQSPATCALEIQTVTETVTVSTCIAEVEQTPLIENPHQKRCGDIIYDPSQYVCRSGAVLCPVINGEPLSLCGKYCYSTFFYNCKNTSRPLPLPELSAHMTLTVSNPQHPKLHNCPVTVCNNELRIGGKTCSYCPPPIRTSGMCPPGNVTVLNNASLSSMAITAPGGQMMFLTKDWGIGVSKAHSTWLPPGAKLGGWRAFEGGGFVNGNEGADGWVACKGKGKGVWKLRSRNKTKRWEGCVGVNLRARRWEGWGAWQYT